MNKRLTFLQFVRFLKKHHKTKKPVIVKRVTTFLDKRFNPPEYDFGETINNGDHYLITINKEDPLRIQKDTLMHEWAHCMISWKSSSHHPNEWGLAYAKVYRTIEAKMVSKQ
jgi:hypothetical protein